MVNISLVLAGCFVLLAANARADANKISTCPYEISQPGQYHVAQDLTCPGNGIHVDSSDVRLFFDGHTMNGMGTGEFGVLVTGSNDSIQGGGTVTRFQFGIVVEGLSESVSTQSNQLVNITVTNSTNQGIILVNSVENRIINCTASTNGAAGMFVGSSANYNTLISNVADGNGGPGIQLFDNYWSTLRANQTDHNGLDGIFVDVGDTQNLIQANKAANNTPFDLADLNANCDSNTWKANQFGTANQPCIQ
jgi:parallel beta-helix repeat protein